MLQATQSLMIKQYLQINVTTIFGNIRYVNFDHIWQRQIKQFVYASNIILIETNMPSKEVSCGTYYCHNSF